MADSTFELEFAEHAADLQDVFGEPITVDGVSTTGIVRRPEANALGPAGLRIEMQIEVFIPKADVASITEKGTVVVLPKVAGGATATMRVTRIIAQNGQHWHVALN